MRRTVLSVGAAAALLALAACSQLTTAKTSPVAHTAAPDSQPPRQGSASTAHLAPPAVPGLTWHSEGTVVRGQPTTFVATTRLGSVALMWMDPALLSFRFIPGSKWPERSPILPADRRPLTWVPRMAAAFNGAFKLRDNAGGYFYAGRTVSPLRPGLAALVITSQGRLSVVQWGREARTTVGLSVVRENLPLLIDQFTARTSGHDTNSTWGWADNNRPLANRSALGELPDGSLVFAYGYRVTAKDMAAALVQVHVRTAMMLDMNLSQPGGFVYWRQAGRIRGRRILPSIFHSASIYFNQYQKDFVAALAIA